MREEFSQQSIYVSSMYQLVVACHDFISGACYAGELADNEQRFDQHLLRIAVTQQFLQERSVHSACLHCQHKDAWVNFKKGNACRYAAAHLA